MKFAIYLISVYLLVQACTLVKSNNKLINNPNFVIYKLNYNSVSMDYGEPFNLPITGLAYQDKKLYYLPHDSLLMTYQKLPENSIEIHNPELQSFFQNFEINQLKNDSVFSHCKCRGTSKAVYVVKIQNKDHQNVLEFEDAIGCDKSSPCYFFDVIHPTFSKFEEYY